MDDLQQTIPDMIDYLIRNSDKIASLAVVFVSDDGSFFVGTSEADIVRNVGLFELAKDVLISGNEIEFENLIDD